MLVHLGDQLGLYKAMTKSGPIDSATLAKQTGTSERLVREWLSAQAAHGYLSYDKTAQKFSLPPEQADQIFATTDPIAERVRKIGGTTLKSIRQISNRQRLLDNDAEFVTPLDMLAELRDDNKQLAGELRRTHALCDEHGDVATASLLEVWIDEAERRTWFLFETTRATGS